MMNYIKKCIFWIIIILYTLLSLYPLILMTLQSFKPEREIWGQPFSLPSVWGVEHYIKAWESAEISIMFMNSLYVTAVTLFFSLILVTMLGYAFGRLSFVGKKLHFSLILSTLLIPTSLLIFPVYVLVFQLGIINTHLGLIFPYLAGSIIMPTLLMRMVFESIPKEIFEAAYIDGAGEYRVLFQVVYKSALPMVATVAILIFKSKWNDYIWASVSLSDPSLFTLPVGMAALADKAHVVGYGTIYAGMAIVTAPVIGLFFVAQKWFLSSVTVGAVKG